MSRDKPQEAVCDSGWDTPQLIRCIRCGLVLQRGVVESRACPGCERDSNRDALVNIALLIRELDDPAMIVTRVIHVLRVAGIELETP